MKRWGRHQSLWSEAAQTRPRDSLREDLDADFAIVGAGITGLTSAFLLAEKNFKVVVVSAGDVGGGATGSSTGHLTHVLDSDFQTMIANFDFETIRKVVASVDEAMMFIEEQSFGESQFQRIAGYKFTESAVEVENLHREVSLSKELGLNAHIVKIHSFPFPVKAVARFENQALMDPLAYTLNLANKAERSGARIFENSRVQEIEDGSPCRFHTEHGSVTARAIILATHTPIGAHLSLQTRVAPYFSYVMAARLKNPPQEGLYWDMADPYQYFRPVSRGQDRCQDLWLIGGKDHKTGQEIHTLERYLALEDYVRSRFDVSEITRYWGGEFFKSVDGLPYIGKIPFSSHLYAGTGYSGTGLAWGTVAGQILAACVGEERNSYAEIYDPFRVKPLASAKSFLRENLNVAAWLVGDLLSHEDMRQIKSIPAGEGRILEVGNKKLAVFKDERNNISAMNAACTHMGCTVHWNSAEKTWDCPCHGGRYGSTGNVISGPPMKDLRPASFQMEKSRPEESQEARINVPSYNPFDPLPEHFGF